MTKTELLEKLHQLHACNEAKIWVHTHASDDAEVIYMDCDDLSWLTWLYDVLGILDRDSKTWHKYIRAMDALHKWLWPLEYWDLFYAKFLPQLKLPWGEVQAALEEIEI